MYAEVIEHIAHKKILFSPLNWGFGHVSRSIPILQQLLNQGNTIFIACDQHQQQIYLEYFPNAQFVLWEGYPFKFSGKGNFALDLFLSLPKLIAFGKKELIFVPDFCKKEGIEIVLSDHRYFFRNSKRTSILITHQLTLPLPWYLKIAQIAHKKWLNRFHEIWILDTKNHQFAGKLSKGKTKPIQFFLGPVSRFEEVKIQEKNGTLILVSGPEPYARQFYEVQKAKLEPDQKLVYKGKMETLTATQTITWKALDAELMQTQKLISRSGYSTIMDVHFLNCQTEFSATKGQWEQEYLSGQLDKSSNN